VVTGAGQVVAIQLLALLAAAAVQLATGTFVVTIAAGQVVVVQLLDALAAAAVQVCTGTLVVTVCEQVIVTKLLPAFPVCGVQV
jgi:hypothetical protein